MSFSNYRRPRTASLAFTSRRMQESLHRQRRQQEELAIYEQTQDPGGYEANFEGYQTCTPGHDGYCNEQYSEEQQYQPREASYVRTRDSREMRFFPPPTRSDQMSPSSSVSPVRTWETLQHPSRMSGTIRARLEGPLPPLPSQFRLGEDELPWAAEPWYVDAESDHEASTGAELENRRQEDPQRVKDLGDLQQAMMTVDILPHDRWEPWTWDTPEDMPRGPGSLGWAVRSEESRRSVSPVRPPYRKPMSGIICQSS